MSTPAEYQTFTLEQVCKITKAPSVDWLSRRISSGKTDAVLAGHSWVMTRSDMAELVKQMREEGRQRLAKRAAHQPVADSDTSDFTAPVSAGLSKRSAARLKRPA